MIDKVQNLGKERRLIYKDSFQDSGHGNISYARYVEKHFTQIYRRHACAYPDGHQHGGRKSTETSVTEVCCKSMNLSLDGLQNIKIILFLIQELFR